MLPQVEARGIAVPIKRPVFGMALGLALSACTSAPPPEQPKADWAPCGGYKSNEGAVSYARCIKYVATPVETEPPRAPLHEGSRS